MATPLFQTLIKPTDFDLFLDEIGLDNLSPGSRVELIDKATQAIEYGLVTKIFRKLAIDDQIKLVELMREADKTHNEAPVNELLLEKLPMIETLVDEVIEDVKNDLRLSTHGMKRAIDQQVAMLRHDLTIGQPRETDSSSPQAADPGTTESPAPPPPPPTIPEPPTSPRTPEPFPWEVEPEDVPTPLPTVQAAPDELDAINAELEALKNNNWTANDSNT